MDKRLYHQIENTNDSVLSTYVYDYNSWEFNSPHFHKNYEILVPVRGTCTCFIGSQSYTLQRGEAIFIQPFRIHGLRVEAESALRCITFHEHMILTVANALAEKRVISPVFRVSHAVLCFVLDQMEAHFGTRCGYNKQLDPSKKLILKACLYALCSALVEQTALENAEKNADNVIVDVVQFISENFKNNITLQDIAEQKGYSYHYLSRLFNKSFQITFKTMLNQYRMEYAVALLLDTSYPVSRIAYESGFQNLRSFNHYCREIYHTTPRELRKRRLG